MMMWGYGFSWGGALMMLISTLIGIAILIVILLVVVRWWNRSSVPYQNEPVKPSATQILEQRYARGEIDEATFQRMRDQLQR